MLVAKIKNELYQYTVLVFPTTMKGRLMGKNVNLGHFDSYISPPSLQSKSFVYDFGTQQQQKDVNWIIPIDKISYLGSYETELYPGLIVKLRHINITLFAYCKCIITGVKNIQDEISVKTFIDDLFTKYAFQNRR